MFSFRTAPPPPPKTKLQRVKEKVWYLCCSYKIGCSVWMLTLFGLSLLYLRDNYTNISFKNIMSVIPNIGQVQQDTIISNGAILKRPINDIEYLHINAYHNIGYGTCPYSNPNYPSIGPDISYICPSDKQYRAGSVWYLQKDISQNIPEKDTKSSDDLDKFLKNTEVFQEIVRNNTNSNDTNLQISFKKIDKLHLTFQYISCQEENDILSLKKNWNDLVQNEDVLGIIKNAGYESWNDVQVCFDRVLCMNDNYFGGYSYNLYLNEKSQKLMKQLIDKTEEIEKKEYDIDLTFKRVEHQQAFHITLCSITNTFDYDSFDAKKLMNEINDEMKSKDWGCFKLGIPPPLKNEWCFNSKQLKDKGFPKFQWKCAPIE